MVVCFIDISNLPLLSVNARQLVGIKFLEMKYYKQCETLNFLHTLVCALSVTVCPTSMHKMDFQSIELFLSEY